MGVGKTQGMVKHLGTNNSGVIATFNLTGGRRERSERSQLMRERDVERVIYRYYELNYPTVTLHGRS